MMIFDRVGVGQEVGGTDGGSLGLDQVGRGS